MGYTATVPLLRIDPTAAALGAVRWCLSKHAVQGAIFNNQLSLLPPQGTPPRRLGWLLAASRHGPAGGVNDVPGAADMFRVGDPAPPRLRSVEVARGRAGYGFTLSGQAPCVLSCVLRGSPADLVGLRAGDQILAVNEINVKKASHEDVVKLIGKCSGVLHMVIAEGGGHLESCSSDEEFGFYEGKGWLKPKLDSKALGINRAERVVEEMQSGGIFNMIFENPGLRASSSEPLKLKQRSLSESAAGRCDLAHESASNLHPSLPSKEETPKVGNHGSAFGVGLEAPEDFGLDASILNVAMVVGYLGSIELPSAGCSLELDSVQAIRGCLRRLRAEQKIHSLVTMKVMHDCVQLCTDKAAVLARYPAERLAFSAVCPDDIPAFPGEEN